jgi:DNA gyrase subunit B
LELRPDIGDSGMNAGAAHHQKIRDQFAQRIQTYETSARWMLAPELITAHRRAAGLAPREFSRAVDLCCGTGIVGRHLLDLGWLVEGLDLTPEMAAVAATHFPTRTGSVENMPFADGSFDLATLRQSLMLVDAQKTVQEVHRVLAPGGRFVLLHSVPFGDADDGAYSAVQKARHINIKSYLRAADLEDLLETNGLKVIHHDSLRVRESVDHWLNSAPELSTDLRGRIRDLIVQAPESYKNIRRVEIDNGELFEDWNWSIITAQKIYGRIS